MTQTEWIISLDDDLKDYDELFVGNVRDGDRLIRCKDCVDCKETLLDGRTWKYCETIGCAVNDNDYCCWAERKEE